MMEALISPSQSQAKKPLLTIAVPTYNRSRFLGENLEALLPQLIDEPRVELIVSDNASTDDTAQVVEEFVNRGLPARYSKNAQNTRSDGNILRCFELAGGTYIWIVGDDDIVLPGAVARVVQLLTQQDCDLAYLQPFAFREDYLAEKSSDPFGRTFQILTDRIRFAREAGQLIMFITAIIVNKDRYLQLQADEVSDLFGSSLIQMGWILPTLAASRRTLVVHERLIGQRIENGSGWGVCRVFGVNFFDIVDRYLAEDAKLANEFRNAMLRRWLPYMVMSVRQGNVGPLDTEDMEDILHHRHRGDWRYWLYIYPLISQPMPLARGWAWLLAQAGRLSLDRITAFVQNRLTMYRSRFGNRLCN